jgi:hypothetical protein
MRKRMTLAVAASVSALVGGALFIGSPSASAGTSDGSGIAGTNCGGTVWPDLYVNVREIRPETFHGRHVILYNGRASDGSYGAIDSGHRNGDLVWVDRRAPGAGNWEQCGPFRRWHTNRLDNFGWEMRACAQAQGETRCTSWYHDRG